MVRALNATELKELLPRFRVDPLAFAENLIIPSAHGIARFGDVMGDFQKKRFRSIAPALLSVSRGEKPPIGRHWWEATKGASKDSDLAVCALWITQFTVRPKPLDGQVGAADADQAGELRKAALDIVRLNPWLDANRPGVGGLKKRGAGIRIDARKIINVATGSQFEIIAADRAGSHGARPDVLILNELSHVTLREFAENLMDNAEKVPWGLVCVATNAGFRNTWQWEWRENARTSPLWHFDKYSQPSPWLDAAHINEARVRNSLARFNRLWMGEWVSGGGDALNEDDIRAAIREDMGPLSAPIPGHIYMGGLDLGVKHDHSASVVLGCDQVAHRVYLAQCQSWAPGPTGEVDLIAVQQAVLNAQQRFNCREWLFDASQAILMSQQLNRLGVPMTEMKFAGANLDRMATVLIGTFRSRMIELFPDEALVADLLRLTLEDRGKRGYKLSAIADEKGHADRAIALAIVLPAAVDIAGANPTIMWEMSTPFNKGFAGCVT